MKNRYTTSIFQALVLTTSLQYAQSAVAAGFDENPAHLHGHAQLNLVIEHNQLEIQFNSPAVNLVGFEYQASTADEMARVEKLRQQLTNVSELYRFSGSECQLKTAKIDLNQILPEQPIRHTKPSDQDSQTEHHDHYHKDEAQAQHSEIKARYQFNCTEATKLTVIEVNFFNQFEHLNYIQALWITHQKQGLSELERGANYLKLDE